MNNLREFFLEGRKKNGSYMGATECVTNAVQRNLSCLSIEELSALRSQATTFIEHIDSAKLELSPDGD